MNCTLCHTPAALFATVEGREYFRCPNCQLTFEHPDKLPSAEQEKGQYDLHDNRPDDPGYRKFLSQLAEPLKRELPPGARGLDFGCGPGPALAMMLREQGFDCATWDPLYASDKAALEPQYDFVTCTEVIEHLHQPAKEWQWFSEHVKPGGWLGIMTRWLIDDDAFARWHYRRDPTHVCFWQPATFQWLARKQGWDLHLTGNPVVLMQKRPPG
ncbi:class I SAM-dependent methyltransferase [Alcanivorax sp. S6407]|uniref:class I SAM-dependent methyltransferase n=1 Tax=Alcanivorax sp. S6407 TaxID=2926424 RepID=UPI001FF6677B|nr:class I SAM-dependent methyltransferase [Alcanivorax sp. S6407]MCK0154696.1 class I SAM-dependent methyltransferase [Alcanivorax sp. S6407]